MAKQVAVTGIRSLITGTVLNAIDFPAPMDARITRILVQIASPNEEGDTLFDVKVEGESIFGDPGDRPKILAGERYGQVDVDFEVQLRNQISVDVVSAPLGGITGLFIECLLDDTPTAAQYVRAVYQGAYGRDPTELELESAVGGLESGCAGNTMLDATKSLLDMIFEETEYTDLATDDTQYVTDLYEAVLNRPPDSGGLAFWVANLSDTGTRQTVRDAFNESNEHVVSRIIGFCPNTLPGCNAIQLQGQPVISGVPSNGDVLLYNSGEWVASNPPYTKVDGSVAFTGDQSMGSHKLTNVADPASAQDAATKFYVDALKAGFDVKDSVRAATTANITLSGAQTIDGVSVIAGERVLVKNQSTGSQNGIYVCASGAWSRSTDADASAEVTAGLAVVVEEGTTQADTFWWLTTNNPITLGSTALVFAQFGSGGPTGSAGGTLGGTYPNPTVNTDGSTLETSSNALRVKDGGITAAKLAANSIPFRLVVAVSDETTAIITGTAKVTFRMPAAVSITSVRANLNTVSSSGNPAFDVNKNGSTIFSTTLTVDTSEKTSLTAATPAVLVSSPTTFADDDEVTIDIDTAGTGAKGAKITFVGTYS